MYYYKCPFALVFGSNILDVETKFIATIDLLKKPPPKKIAILVSRMSE